MDGHEGPLEKLSHFVHKHLLWLMIGSYAVAAFAPSLGLWIRDVSVGDIALFGSKTRISLSMLMLASLLLNAGLGVKLQKVREMLRSPNLLGAGLGGQPVDPDRLHPCCVTRAMAGWHNAMRFRTSWWAWPWLPPCRSPAPRRPGPRTPTAS